MSAPLAGVTVLDLTRNLAGPYATMVLGDLGARVIKVERPGTGDDTRAWTPPTWAGHSALFLALNRNKESVALDVDDAADVARIRALAARADVVVESERPGSLARRGLGFDDVRALHPRVVYCSISGFGSVGPDRDRPGYDTIVQAASGVMSINGDPGGTPSRVGPSIVDQGTGTWAALGILAALRRRDLDDAPQHVETSLLETGVAWVGYQTSNHLASGIVPGPQGSRHAQMAPYEGFATRDGHLFVAALNDALFRRLCAELGLDDLTDDPGYRTNADRVARRDALAARIQEVLRTDDAASWEARLRSAGLPCSRVRTLDQVVADPQVAALGLLRAWSHPDIPDLRLVDHPLTYDGVRSFRHDLPPALGEHTDAVLSEPSDPTPRRTATIVLLHGGRHGGWCWEPVARLLRRAGHRVLTPTLTGLGERRHLAGPSVDLATHVADVENLLVWEDLRDVVLVAHSYGGMVATAVADRCGDRLAQLVYLDALVPRDGEAVLDLVPAAFADAWRARVSEEGDGWRLPGGPEVLVQYGVEDPDDLAWAGPRITDQPFATYTSPVSLRGGQDRVARTYVRFTRSEVIPAAMATAARDDAAWGYRELAVGHDGMISHPREVADLIVGFAP